MWQQQTISPERGRSVDALCFEVDLASTTTKTNQPPSGRTRSFRMVGRPDACTASRLAGRGGRVMYRKWQPGRNKSSWPVTTQTGEKGCGMGSQVKLSVRRVI